MRCRLVIAAVALLALQACAGALGNLNALVQPPRFQQVPGRQAEIRVLGLEGAGVRIWTRVTNPNTFGIRLGTLKGTLFLEEARAADAEFPLGLDLGAGADTELPIDISVSFRDLPGLGGVARKVLAREAVPYRLDGTIGIDAGRIGRDMLFGPMTLLRGEAVVPIR
ncbi:MAG TPA: LEA type 2 family protein [Vicinamibacterales bacterium]|nr:LEA type 2 family protein [Vicinamibacterales bacterium]